MSDVRYEIKTPLPDIRLENIDKLRFVRNELTQLILVDPVDDEDEEIRVLGLLILQL